MLLLGNCLGISQWAEWLHCASLVLYIRIILSSPLLHSPVLFPTPWRWWGELGWVSGCLLLKLPAGLNRHSSASEQTSTTWVTGTWLNVHLWRAACHPGHHKSPPAGLFPSGNDTFLQGALLVWVTYNTCLDWVSFLHNWHESPPWWLVSFLQSFCHSSVPRKGSYLLGFLILQLQTTGSVITPTLEQAGDNVFTWTTAKIFLCISQLTQDRKSVV